MNLDGSSIRKSVGQQRKERNMMRGRRLSVAACPLIALWAVQLPLWSNIRQSQGTPTQIIATVDPTILSGPAAGTSSSTTTTTEATTTTTEPTTTSTEATTTTTAPTTVPPVVTAAPTVPTTRATVPVTPAPTAAPTYVPPSLPSNNYSSYVSVDRSAADATGATGSITITATGITGNTPAKTVNVSIPGNLQVTSNPANYGNGVWNFPGVAGGQTVTLTIPVKAVSGGAVTVTVTSGGWSAASVNWFIS